jgi:hypothetical protein
VRLLDRATKVPCAVPGFTSRERHLVALLSWFLPGGIPTIENFIGSASVDGSDVRCSGLYQSGYIAFFWIYLFGYIGWCRAGSKSSNQQILRINQQWKVPSPHFEKQLKVFLKRSPPNGVWTKTQPDGTRIRLSPPAIASRARWSRTPDSGAAK